jgi:hypothetical protein
MTARSNLLEIFPSPSIASVWHSKQGEKKNSLPVLTITVQFVTVPKVEGENESDAERDLRP